ncbi:MAG: hypothetical protein CMB21_05575 [Euryarchaeota archaeon]|jgi:flagellin FlaB|nr:hypothetical protein [Euryarchaeota archaeon]|tara:strand:+ start:377 stop:958 length:582 start_codon:yes stop_codon:yes gene_type:complete
MKIDIKNKDSEEMGAIGIGAMIVFIALILVAAVASAVIIQTGEKLQQNAQQTGSDTQNEISGKITIIAVTVGDQTNDNEMIDIVFESAPGSEPISDTNVHWTVVCDPAAGTVPGVQAGDFAAATDIDLSAMANNIILPGQQYLVSVQVGDGVAATTCEPALNAEHQLIVHVDGGGSTYETLSYNSITQGALVV